MWIERSIAGACILVSIAGCSGPERYMTPREKQVAYQREHFEPRIDELLTSPSARAFGPTRSTADASPVRTPRVGERVTVAGRVVASSENAHTGEVENVVIEAGDYRYQVTEERAQEILASHLGKEVEMKGVVTAVAPNRVVVNVDDYRIAG